MKPNQDYDFRLHKCYKSKKNGFTIIEVLVVVLLIGIISGLAAGAYSGAIQNTSLKSARDRIGVFFRACKDRARLRKQNLTIAYSENQESLIEVGSPNNRLKVPDLCPTKVPKQIEIGKDGKFWILGKEVYRLELCVKTSGKDLATITIEL